ncbi:MAG: ABC transporter ATP-binding protein [Clostridia bacterium]|nr:ABC transporter ATP-binding protein [Clostridia bacterium]
MESNIAIHVEHVSKEFKVFFDKGVYLKERALFKERNRHEIRRVLKDISFDVKRGEAIGLVGENGCGKSTMLKLLSRIMYPDGGKVETFGRLSALIELGAGFHPDMSGRENIYTNAAIFGLSKAEIDARLQTIIDFSELGDYIDNPVRTYSSGMYMRLAFSVAINVDADILLIDEILAVGDVAFQAKCFNKLREIKKNGTTIVIVSHSLGQIEQICDKSYWIEGGLIRQQGNPVEVHQKYLRYMGERTGTLSAHDEAADAQTQPAKPSEGENEAPQGAAESAPEPQVTGEFTSEDGNRWGNNDIVFTTVWLEDENGVKTNRLECGKPFSIVMPYRIIRPVEDVAFGIGIFRNDGLQCYGTNTEIERIPVEPSQEGCARFKVRYNALLEGWYHLDIALHKADGFPYDYCRSCLDFSVFTIDKDAGVMRLEHEWQFE